MSLPAVVPDLAELGARAAEFARASRSENTRRAYQSDWSDFEQWCTAAGCRSALPAHPTTVGAYLADRAGQLKAATLSRRIAAIAAVHRLQGFGFDPSHPAIADVLSGIRRRYGSRQDAKQALMTEDLRRMVRAVPATPIGIRDRALLLVGFAGALRRSELVALDRDDVAITSAGLTLVVRHSKTDQEGRGREVGIPRSKRSTTCPVAALEAWLDLFHFAGEKDMHVSACLPIGPADRPTDGPTDDQTDAFRVPLFIAINNGRPGGRLGDRQVARIVKQAAARVGIDPSRVAGHSLRSGFATSAARGGADLSFIMQQTGHKNADVARRYVQRGKLLQNPASKAVKL
jgi:site-specific recombinase XerD